MNVLAQISGFLSENIENDWNTAMLARIESMISQLPTKLQKDFTRSFYFTVFNMYENIGVGEVDDDEEKYQIWDEKEIPFSNLAKLSALTGVNPEVTNSAEFKKAQQLRTAYLQSRPTNFSIDDLPGFLSAVQKFYDQIANSENIRMNFRFKKRSRRFNTSDRSRRSRRARRSRR